METKSLGLQGPPGDIAITIIAGVSEFAQAAWAAAPAPVNRQV